MQLNMQWCWALAKPCAQRTCPKPCAKRYRRKAGQLQHAINSAKRAAPTHAFEACRNDHNQAAQLLEVHPNYLYRLTRNFGMDELLKGIARD